MARNFSEVAALMQGVIEGSVAAAEFSRVVRSRVADDEWLIALALALRELGGLIERTSTIPFERQRMLAAQSAQLAAQRQEALDVAISERDDLLLTVRQQEKAAAKMREQLDFLSMFTPPEPPDDAPHSARERRGGRFANTVGRAAAAERKRLADEAAAKSALGFSPRESRAKRINVHTHTFKAHEKDFGARLEAIQSAHAGQVSRLEARIAEERRAHAAAFEGREEVIGQRRKKEEKRLALAEAEAEQMRKQEATARAQGAAAAGVMHEQHIELTALRDELERLKLQLRTEQAKNKRMASTTSAYEPEREAPAEENFPRVPPPSAEPAAP